MRHKSNLLLTERLYLAFAGLCSFTCAEDLPDYKKDVLPILEEHCYDCHGDGENKGKVSLDEFTDLNELMKQKDLWWHALKNVRSEMMPPAKKDRLSEEEKKTLLKWIQFSALKNDAKNPDPGRVTLRRLNRVEYRNTIRDLMGIEFRTDEEFPADDTGYGFDTIGDVLTISPLLLEKYIQAADRIVAEAVPTESQVSPYRRIGTGIFNQRNQDSMIDVSLYDSAEYTGEFEVKEAGTYRITLDASVHGSFAYDPSRSDFTWEIDGKPIEKSELVWQDYKKVRPATELHWEAGKHTFRIILKALVGKDQQPPEQPGDGAPYVSFHINGVDLSGPLEKEFLVHPKNYERFFPRDTFPENENEQKIYASEIMRNFTTRAYRRPVDDATVERLVGFAFEMPNQTFPARIARAMSAVIASPRFLFRTEEVLPTSDPEQHPLLDEYALASRLSYFLWSTMPDDELFQLAKKGELRKNLSQQINRMLNDDRVSSLVQNFVGQWLQTRDIEGVSIDARIIEARDAGTEKEMEQAKEKFQLLSKQMKVAKEAKDEAKANAIQQEIKAMFMKFRRNGKRLEFSQSLRLAMKMETQRYFRHLLNQNQSVVKLLESDETFLNEELANHYGIPNVQGGEMRLVKLPAHSERGGILTMGNTLAVTSNPTRTSPVKRGFFILDNILGTPPPPPPVNVPALETSEKTKDGRELSLSETLSVHRENALCSSCHNRMDPLGLAFENFNAMGKWREQERKQAIPKIDGKLITGEKFTSVQELKHILATAKRTDFYRCISEKLLTYAIGRGMEASDEVTLDAIVTSLEKNDGKFHVLIQSIIESPAFQKRRKN